MAFVSGDWRVSAGAGRLQRPRRTSSSSPRQKRRRVVTASLGGGGGGGGSKSGGGGGGARNDAGGDSAGDGGGQPPLDVETYQQIEDFLTQRALQTLLYYFTSLHDDTTFNWLENFAGHKGIFEYHGFMGLRMPWKRYLLELWNAEPEEVEVRKRAWRRQGTEGNPYVEQPYITYDISIEPRQLAKKLMDIREHLAAEMTSDLPLIERENEELRVQHNEEVRHKEDRLQRLRTPPKFIDTLFHANSPFRGGTYDLLKKYTTFVALRRVLLTMERDSVQRNSHQWLLTFAQEHGKDFDGDHGYHIAERFVKLLWQQPPRLRSVGAKNKKHVMVDPDSMVQAILEKRLEVAKQWTQCLSRVPSDHMTFKRRALEDLL